MGRLAADGRGPWFLEKELYVAKHALNNNNKRAFISGFIVPYVQEGTIARSCSEMCDGKTRSRSGEEI